MYQVMLTHLLSILSLMKSFTILANFHSSCHCHHHLQSPQTEDLFSFFHFQTMSLTVPLPPPFYTLPKVHWWRRKRWHQKCSYRLCVEQSIHRLWKKNVSIFKMCWYTFTDRIERTYNCDTKKGTANKMAGM